MLKQSEMLETLLTAGFDEQKALAFVTAFHLGITEAKDNLVTNEQLQAALADDRAENAKELKDAQREILRTFLIFGGLIIGIVSAITAFGVTYLTQ